MIVVFRNHHEKSHDTVVFGSHTLLALFLRSVFSRSVSLALLAALRSLSPFLRIALSCSVSLAYESATWFLTCSLRFIISSNASNAPLDCFCNFLSFTAVPHFGQVLLGIMKTKHDI